MANININLNDPTQNQQYTDMGGAANYALTMGQGIDPKTGKPYGQAAGGVGSVAIPWVKSSGVGSNFLPDSVKAALFGIDPATGLARQSAQGYDPFADATGYAYDPTSGALIIQNKNGSSSFVGNTGYIQDASGNFVPKVPKGTNNTITNTNTTNTTNTTTAITSPSGASIVSTYADPTTGDVTAVFSDGTTKVLAKSGAVEATQKSAYDLLYQQFNDLGIGALVPALKDLISEGVSPAEFTLRLRNDPTYKKRFAANDARIAKGLRALSEAEYIGLEDQYQDVMRRYGLPESYYARGDMGIQSGFEKLIANDVSNVELEDRVSTAQNRVLNANPEIAKALKVFYPDITNSDILAYTLDPKNAIEQIKRKVTAAEIGVAAVGQNLATNVTRAEQLGALGVTGAQYAQAAPTIAEATQRGGQLASMYGQSPYTQATAEQEILNLAGSADAAAKRKKLTQLERASFSSSTGAASDALSRDRALSQMTYRSPGAGNF